MIDVTDGSTSYIFKPSSAMFPNNLAPNMSYAEAQGLVMQQSILSIHQFSDPNNVNSSETAQDFSHSFVVIDGWDVAYIQYAREEVRREWSRKFRLALAVGIPLTFCVTWFLAVTYAWWWSKRRVARDGEKGLTARTWWWGF
jgi:hypothetical protein